MRDYKVQGAPMNNNTALTGEIDLGGATLFAIELPSTWAGVTISFQSKTQHGSASGDDQPDDQEAWKDVYDDSGTEVTATVAANRIVAINVAALSLSSLRYIRIRSGTSASPVAQSPTKVIKVITKE